MTTTGPGGARTDNYRYNAIGDVTSAGARAMTWDVQGRLAQLSESGRTAQFQYDAGGQRIIRRDSTGTTLTLPGQELRLNGTTLTATRYYSHGGATVAVRTAAGLTWLAADHHGTALVAVNSTTMATSVRRTDPFGNPRGTQPAEWPGERGFVGGTTDPTGLTHLGAREYDPDTGRFIAPDPVVDTNDPQQLNGYAYANNDPTTMSDPTGLKYYIDADGLVDIPSLRNPQVIEKASQRSAAIYRYRDQQKRRYSRALQHDWDGLDGKRGHVGESAPRPATQAVGNLLQDVQNSSLDKMPGAMSDAAKVLSALVANGPIKSGSICLEAFVGAGFGSGGGICANFDSHGMTVSGGFKYGIDVGIEAYVALSIKLNPTDAASQNRDQFSASYEAGPEGLKKGTNYREFAKDMAHLVGDQGPVRLRGKPGRDLRHPRLQHRLPQPRPRTKRSTRLTGTIVVLLVPTVRDEGVGRDAA